MYKICIFRGYHCK